MTGWVATESHIPLYPGVCHIIFEKNVAQKQPTCYSPTSPTDTFKKVALMNFSQALEALKQGEKVTRNGWNGKDMFLFLVPGSTFLVNRPPLLGIYEEGHRIDYQPHIDMKTVDETVVPWLASQSDLLADDWFIVE